MSKKMLKRSLALGALMAFVITGNVWAETTYNATFNDKVTENVIVSENVNNKYIGGIDLDNKNFSNSGTVDASGSSVIYKNSSVQGFSNQGTIIANVVDIYDNYQGATLSGNITATEEFIWRGRGKATYLNSILDTGCLHIIAETDTAGLMVNNSKVLENVSNILLDSQGAQSSLRFRDNGNISYDNKITLKSINDGSAVIEIENNCNASLNEVVVDSGKGVIQFNYHGSNLTEQLARATIEDIKVAKESRLDLTSWAHQSEEIDNKSTLVTLGELTVDKDGVVYANVYDTSDKQTNLEIAGNITMNLSAGSVVDFGAMKSDDKLGNKIFVNASSLTINVKDDNDIPKVYLSNASDTLENEKITVNSIAELEKIKDVVWRTQEDETPEDSKPTLIVAEGVQLVQQINSVEDTITGTVAVDPTDSTKSIVTDISSSQNSDTFGVAENNALSLITWRAEINDMNKRMGELRNANGEHGVWVRMVRGEDEYESINHQYNQYQLGYDEKLSVDPSWTVGLALSYTEGDSTYSTGSAENKHKGFSVYGSKLNDDGTFIDLIAKYARLENDFDTTWGTGDYSTNGYSVSAEFGKRIQQGKGVWVEPQVELTYGKVSAVDYKIGNVAVAQDGIESLVGRVGFSLGKDIKQGNVYARASYLYDFDGETSANFVDTVSGGKPRTLNDDLGGGWWEVGVGANINLSKATYIYADVEKTFGGEVDTNWQWNLGVRYSF